MPSDQHITPACIEFAMTDVTDPNAESGSYDGEILQLCTAQWGYLCSLRYRTDDKQLYLQFRDDDLRSVSAAAHSADRGRWAGLGWP